MNPLPELRCRQNPGLLDQLGFAKRECDDVIARRHGCGSRTAAATATSATPAAAPFRGYAIEPGFLRTLQCPHNLSRHIQGIGEISCVPVRNPPVPGRAEVPIRCYVN